MSRSYAQPGDTLTYSSRKMPSYSMKLLGNGQIRAFTNFNSPKNQPVSTSQGRFNFPTKSATESYKSSFVGPTEKNDINNLDRRASDHINQDYVGITGSQTSDLRKSTSAPKYSEIEKIISSQRMASDPKYAPTSTSNRLRISTEGTDTNPKPPKKGLEINTEAASLRYSNNYRSLTTKNSELAEKVSETPSQKSTLVGKNFEFGARLNSKGDKQDMVTVQSTQLASGSYTKAISSQKQSGNSSNMSSTARAKNGMNGFYSSSNISYSPPKKTKTEAVPTQESDAGNYLGQKGYKVNGKSALLSNSAKFDGGFGFNAGTSSTEAIKGAGLANSVEFSSMNRASQSNQITKETQKSSRSSSKQGYASRYTNANSNRESLSNNSDAKVSYSSRISMAKQPENANQKSSDKVSLESFITKVNKGEVLGSKIPQKDTKTIGRKPTLTLEDTQTNGLSTRGYSSKLLPKTTTSADVNKYTAISSKDSKNESTGFTISKGDSRGLTPSSRDDYSPMIMQDKPTFTYYVSSLERYHRSIDEADYFCQLYREHFLQTYQAMHFCKFLKPADPQQLKSKKVFLTKRDTHKEKRTLVFDLDETLIHCNESVDMPCDVRLPIKFPHGEVIEAGINIRPYAIEALRELSIYYEIIVFTASHGCYANVVLDYLDPSRQYIHHRLFRDSCIQTEEGIYIKDLRVIANRNLNDIILVDNAAYSFGYQIENGIPILPFYDSPEDKELKHLVTYLKAMATAKDLREINRETFKLHMYTLYNTPDKVIEKVLMSK